MFTIFKEEKVITAGILVFLCLSVLVRLMLAWMYHTMIRETDNLTHQGALRSEPSDPRSPGYGCCRSRPETQDFGNQSRYR